MKFLWAWYVSPKCTRIIKINLLCMFKWILKWCSFILIWSLYCWNFSVVFLYSYYRYSWNYIDVSPTIWSVNSFILSNTEFCFFVFFITFLSSKLRQFYDVYRSSSIFKQNFLLPSFQVDLSSDLVPIVRLYWKKKFSGPFYTSYLLINYWTIS